VQAEIEQAGGGAATPPADRAASLQPAR